MGKRALNQSLLQHDVGAVRILTLSRPERLNALDHALRSALVDALGVAASDETVRSVLLTGAGQRAFCAGQDINESATLGGADEGDWIGSWARMFAAFFDFPKPLVAGLNGITAGGGMEIAMFCDLRIAAASADLLMAEVDVGLPAIIGGHWLAALVGESRMREIVLSGRRIAAAEAHDMGLLHEVVADAELAATALARADALAAKPPVAMHLNIRRFRELSRAGLERAEVFKALRSYQNEAMASGQPQQAMDAFLASRRARRDEGG